MRVNRSAWMATALLLCAGAVSAQQLSFSADTPASDVPTEPKAPVSFDLSAIDKTADPCVDFYAFACGNWRKANPIPGDQSRWGRFNELAERNRYLLYVDLKAAADHPTSPLQRKYGDFFAACMNTDIAEQLGDKPLLPVFHRIEAMKDKKELAATVAWLEAQNGTGSLFRFGVQQDQKDSSQQIEGVGQGGITLPDRDYYLEANERMATIRGQYHDYIASIMKLTGDSDGKADTEATQVIGIETELAKGSMPRDQMRDPDKRYHIMTLTQLEALEPTFNWQAYFTGIHAPAVDTLNVGQPDFFTAENTVLTNQSLDALKAYLKFHAINNVAPWLSASYADANFNFFQKTLNGQAEQTARWKRCTSVTDRALGEAVGQDWVKQNFPPQAKQNMEQLVAALEKALGQDIQSLPWMTDDTKKQAEEKLADFRQKIGYPDKWRDYTPLKITRGDFVSDLRNSSKFEFNYDLNKVGKPVDEKEWGMTPPTVNAYYNPGMNDINFPAGILQPPFYDFSKDPAVNFGGIGVVIGHEMTHGFDDEGSKYDGKGNVKPWWTDADRKAFEAKLDCEVKEYGGFEPVDGVHLNGKLTLGENTADNGGIHVAWQALLATLAQQGKTIDDKIDGYTEAQRYFIAFGQIWCENRTDQISRVSAKTDPHSPGRFRTDGVVQNFDEFGKAFGCHAGQPMMPENACRVW
ncbi:MAG TPA: M13 family metallopeptidase [Acidobacteriaceae bacterium]|jgi:putative endopeptidase|nr:M13 family metallopeptidase [Acidobacteriaceae bacterium]